MYCGHFYPDHVDVVNFSTGLRLALTLIPDEKCECVMISLRSAFQLASQPNSLAKKSVKLFFDLLYECDKMTKGLIDVLFM